jgi:uncharacterized protein YdaU (DUF1376 family)
VITKKPRLKQAPAVQIYPSDIMATKEYRLMTLEQRGLFISLYLDLWVNREAPLEISDLSRYLGYSEIDTQNAFTEHLFQFFEIRNDSIVCESHEEYMAKLVERRKKQSAGGKKGAENKRTKSKLVEGQPEGSRVEKNRVELNGKEVSRDDQIRSESIDNDSMNYDNVPLEHKEWVEDYDKH